jgi:hypothetical protein
VKARTGKLILAAVLAAAMADTAHSQGGEWTVHTVSYHFAIDKDTDLNNINPGLGYDVSEYVRVGGYYNSFEKPSLYAAAFAEVYPRVKVGLGLVTGYQFDGQYITGSTYSVMPLVGVEVRITDNLAVAWFGQALNLEVKF